MTGNDLALKTGILEIEVCRKPPYASGFRQFTGFIRKHPFDPERVVLIMDPFSYPVSYCEFYLKDLGGVEELPNLVSDEGESVPIMRLWIRKGSIAVKCAPFIV